MSSELKNSNISSCDDYLSIASPTEGLYKDNGSRFISFAYPCTEVEQAEELIKALRKKYYDATHHCYAYRLGPQGEPYRINDDGEPSSTAGRPIYGEILSKQLSDILVVVVRYFGGVKLGVPGLIKAYKAATASALESAKIITKTATIATKIVFEYQNTDQILKELRKRGIAVTDMLFEQQCSLVAHTPTSQVDIIKEILKGITTEIK